MNKEKIAEIAEKISEFCLYGLIFFISLSFEVVEVFAAVASVAFIIKKILVPDFSFIKQSRFIYAFLFLFIFFMMLSLINSGPYFSQSLYHLLTRWVGYIFISIVVADTLHTRCRIRNAIFVIVLSTSLTALSGFFQYFFGTDFLRGREMMRVRRDIFAITACFKHYNCFAAYLLAFIPLAIVLNFIKLKKQLYKIIVFLWTILLILSLLLTFSRGAWLGFLVGIGTLASLSRKVKVIILISISFLFILFLVPSLRERASFTFQKGGDASRFFIWQTGFEMVKENPFLGKGLDTFKEHYPQYAKRLNPNAHHKSIAAHNIYLQIWAETGIFSLLSFLFFLSIFFQKAIKTISEDLLFDRSLLLIGILCGIISYLVHGFFDSALLYGRTNAPFWLMVGIAQALIANRRFLDLEI